MHDRLIELLRKSGASFERALPKEIADYLISNGVRVLPCACGDTVYFVSRYYGGRFEIYTCVVDHISVYGHLTFLTIYDKNDRGKVFGVEINNDSLFFDVEKAEEYLKGLRTRL